MSWVTKILNLVCINYWLIKFYFCLKDLLAFKSLVVLITFINRQDKGFFQRAPPISSYHRFICRCNICINILGKKKKKRPPLEFGLFNGRLKFVKRLILWLVIHSLNIWWNICKQFIFFIFIFREHTECQDHNLIYLMLEILFTWSNHRDQKDQRD